MTTAAELINGSLRLLGALAEGETPSADSSADALSALNDMLDSWSTERLTVFSTTRQVVNWPIGQIEATFGPTGTLGANVRPIAIDDSSYYTDTASGFDYPLTQVNEAMYNGISSKTLSSSFPQFMFVDNDYPNLRIRIYPAPTRPISISLVAVSPFARFTELSDEVLLPPGYLRAIRYNLAEEISPEFGVKDINPTVTRIALVSKRNLQRINSPDDLLQMPAGMPGLRTWTNIYTGE